MRRSVAPGVAGVQCCCRRPRQGGELAAAATAAAGGGCSGEARARRVHRWVVYSRGGRGGHRKRALSSLWWERDRIPRGDTLQLMGVRGSVCAAAHGRAKLMRTPSAMVPVHMAIQSTCAAPNIVHVRPSALHLPVLQLVRVGSRLCHVVKSKAGMAWKLQDIDASGGTAAAPAGVDGRGAGQGAQALSARRRAARGAGSKPAAPRRRVFSLVLAKAVGAKCALHTGVGMGKCATGCVRFCACIVLKVLFPALPSLGMSCAS